MWRIKGGEEEEEEGMEIGLFVIRVAIVEVGADYEIIF